MQSGPETSDEESVCRISRLEAEPDNPLFHPCKCSGTIKFLHQDCLNQWLKHSGHTHCEVELLATACNTLACNANECQNTKHGMCARHMASDMLLCVQVCKHQFSFTPLYAADAPSRLSWLELLWALVSKGARGCMLDQGCVPKSLYCCLCKVVVNLIMLLLLMESCSALGACS